MFIPLVASRLIFPENDSKVETYEGNLVTLSCTSIGNPKPAIIWSPDDDLRRMINTVTSMDSDGYYTVTSNLTILRVLRQDALTYTCTANNTEGMDTRTFDLVVYCKFATILR